MYRIGGRQRTVHASVLGVSVGIPPLMIRGPNIEKSWTVPGGQFDWGGRLLKSNGGAQRCVQSGWKPDRECKCISAPDCDTNKWSRDESRD